METISQQIVNKARNEAINEINKYGAPPLILFEISEHYSKKLAKKYKANVEIVLLGSYLADYKLGLSLKENRIQDHVKMSSDTASNFLEGLGLEKDTIERVLHCIEAHHGTIKYQTIEAEVVANADCYRFLTIRGVFAFIESLAQNKRMNLDDIIEYVNTKAEEKWQTVSLPDVKRELESNYELIKKLVNAAKK